MTCGAHWLSGETLPSFAVRGSVGAVELGGCPKQPQRGYQIYYTAYNGISF